MPFDIERFRRSRLFATRNDRAFAAGFLLLSASWRSTPAASLLDDDRFLAYVAGYGPAVKRWLKIREAALLDWVKCDDGRLYHPDVARVANDTFLADLLKQGRRALRDQRDISSIAASMRETLMLIDWDQPSSVVKRADTWLCRYEDLKLDSTQQRRVAAGKYALRALQGGRE